MKDLERTEAIKKQVDKVKQFKSRALSQKQQD